MTTVSAWTPPTAERATEAEKARRAVVFGSCPAWCDGTEHLEGDLTQHYADVGNVGPVGVALTQPLDDHGQPSGPVAVIVYGDEYGRRPLDVEHVAALCALLDHARQRVASIGGHARTPDGITTYPG